MSYLVLNVRPYSFKDEENRTREGATITYLDLDNEPEEGEKGLAPLSVSATLDQARGFSSVPGIYDLQFKHRRGAQGKTRVVFHSGTLQKAIEFPRLPERPSNSSS